MLPQFGKHLAGREAEVLDDEISWRRRQPLRRLGAHDVRERQGNDEERRQACVARLKSSPTGVTSPTRLWIHVSGHHSETGERTIRARGGLDDVIGRRKRRQRDFDTPPAYTIAIL